MILLILFILLACIGILLLKLTFDFAMRRGRVWGLNLRPVGCPKCGENVPYLRNQLRCGRSFGVVGLARTVELKMDRWGTEISTAHEPQMLREKVGPLSGCTEAFDEKGKSPIERAFQDEDKER